MFRKGVKKIAAGSSTAVFFALLIVTLVFADGVYNDLDTTIDGVAEVMPLSAGGAAGTTQLYVIPRTGGGDPEDDCNFQDSETVVANVNSSNPAAATVSPSTITFGSCEDVHTLTVTPIGAGTSNITLTEVSNDTGGEINFNPAQFNVHVTASANTPPDVTITGVTGGASYEFGSVPTATCDVIDAEDGNSSFPATLSAISGPLEAYGLGEQTATCSYTDGGGLTATDSVMYLIVDTVDPVITLVGQTPAANANGWNKTDVTVEWSCFDAVTPVVDASVYATLTTEGAGQSASGTCEDLSGNTASDTLTGINIDKTLPSLSPTITPNPVPLNGSATADPGASDSLSGIDTASCEPVDTSTVGAHTVSCTATDLAENTATASASYSVSYVFCGFFQPIDNSAVNNAKAGQAIPIKYCVKDANGNPISDPAHFVNVLSSLGASCGGSSDEVETYAGGSGLQYLGDGYWQFNWKTPKAYAGQCRTMSLVLADGVARSAEFKFK